MYNSTKIIDGFSTVFRQWRSESHCNRLHGYSLKFKVVFEAQDLDSNNWVVDFGFLKNSNFKFDGVQVGEWFKQMFDHTLIVALDDPNFNQIVALHGTKTACVKTMEKVGCEAFALLVFNVLDIMCKSEHSKRVKVRSVECIENEKNSAIYEKS